MCLLRVHTAIGYQPEKMQPAASGAGVFHGSHERWIGKEVAVLNHQVNAGDVHVDDASGSNIQVANFAVTHLAFRQTDKRPARVNQRIGIFAQQAIVGGLARKRDGVGFGFGAVAPSIEDDEHKWFRTGHGSRLAPGCSVLSG